MHIVLLGSARSVHIKKIAYGLFSMGHQVTIISIPKHAAEEQDYPEGIQRILLSNNVYFFKGSRLKDLLEKIGTDLVYCHYASGYGTLLRASGFHPSVLAVWGSDVYDFPHKSGLHRAIVTRNLTFPDAIFSTSHAMARVTQALVDRPIRVTPFGVDLETFTPSRAGERLMDDKHPVRLGFIKGLSEKYGLYYLINALSLLKEGPDSALNHREIQMDVYGDGEDAEALEAQAEKLQVPVVFHGRIPHDEVPKALQEMEIFAVPSTLNSESFGVSAVEAMACRVPLIVSDVDGLSEVTKAGEFAAMVPAKNAEALADAISQIIRKPDEADKRAGMALARVQNRYDWKQNMKNIEEGLQEVYKGTDEEAIAEGGDLER